MPDGTDDVNPDVAETPADLVGLLRQLRDRSGLSFRRIERLARSAGDNLPASTVATMLGRNTLPREELVRALTRACGESPESVDRWLAARRRLVDAAAAPPAVEPEPAGPPDRRPRLGPLLLAATTGAVVAIVAVLAGWWLSRAADREATARPDPTVTERSVPAGSADPGTQMAGGQGPTRIRVAQSGLCLSERVDRDSGQIFQASCAEAFPARSLGAPIAATDGTRYLIRTNHPKFGPGCMGIREGSREVGARVEDDYCGQDGAGEQFHLDPVETPRPGFRLRLVHSGLCVTVDDVRTEWAELLQLPCDPKHVGQVFLVEPAPPEIRPAPLR
ncbi:helix-turn-helix domain-containing protein [Plantactinospora sp. B6F1]|uniref:helix-turn-helix domain-containing protein n=1 Tax=Plantactinospora sp. B6F1 TaxID=3158971 RepID=UPI0032D96F04